MTIDFDKYTEFVDAVTSDSSKDFVSLADRLGDLDRQGANIERLTTAAIGIAAEGGEFAEIVKKLLFQGKPWNEDNRELLIIELGDVINWNDSYWEVNGVIENQLVYGQTENSLTITVSTHMSRRTKLQLERVRHANTSKNKSIKNI